MAQGAGAPPAQDWERELVRQAVEGRFAERHRAAVLAELARMRAAWLAAAGTDSGAAEEMVRFVVRTQLDTVEQSGGDPAFLTEQHYRESASGEMDRDRLWGLDLLIRTAQLTAKDVASLLEMLGDETTRSDALNVLASKGAEAAAAIPRLVRLLGETDQLECCKVLRTLREMGPMAGGAASAVAELANDPDYLVRLEARKALRAIAPERASEFGNDG